MFRSLFSQSSQNKQRVTVQQWHPQELQQRLAEGDTTLELIDVRTPGEYQYDGHIAGSRLLPLSSLMQRIG
ncbi:MAG: rhodanese-like domain-containing protein, partial [Anaerolineales bacterium]|nr:rhodanese-like domain-containing protein [Anaerolineales bacterium]